MLTRFSHRLPVLLVLCLLFSGCATVTRPLNESETPDGTNAYIYGRFQVETNGSSANSSPYGIVLGIKHRGSTRPHDPYGIRFNAEGDVTAIRIKPGSYEFSKFNYVNDMNTIMQSSDFTESKLGINLVIEAGKTYYIGDWTGTVDLDYGYMNTHIEWKIESVENNFLTTTNRFKEKYKNLGALENVALFSPRFSAGFDRSEPSTWKEEDLRMAVKYGEYDLAHQMIAHLREHSALARFYEGGLLFKGRGVEKDEKAGLDMVRRVALDDQQPDALYFMAMEVRKFIEENKDHLDEEKQQQMKELFIKYLISSALNGSRAGVHVLCRAAKPDADPISKLDILLYASCRARQDIELASGEEFPGEPVNFDQALGRMDQQQRELYDSSYEKIMTNFRGETGTL